MTDDPDPDLEAYGSVSSGLDGTEYEIDLHEDHEDHEDQEAELRDTLST